MEQVAIPQAAPSVASRPDSAPVRSLIRWPLRGVITVHTLAILVQAVLAGRFMSGDFEMLRAHFVNSQVVGAFGLAQTAMAIIYWRPGGGRLWPLLICAALSVAEPFQIATGINRILGVHVPLAIAIFATSVLLTVWAWRPSFGERRPAAAPRQR